MAGFNLRAMAVTSVIFGLAAVMAPVQYLMIKVGGAKAQMLPRLYHRIMVKLIGLDIEIIGTPATDHPTLFVSNHISWLDIPVIGASLPTSFIAKREVGAMGAFGTLARLQRTVFVDRERRSKARAQTSEIAARLEEGGNLVLFAEGTSTDGARVLPFKTALFAVAEDHGDAMQIQPMSVVYKSINGLPLTRGTRPMIGWYGDMELLPHFLTILAIGKIGVELRFHEPVKVTSFGSRKALASHCYEEVRSGLLAARRGRRHELAPQVSG